MDQAFLTETVPCWNIYNQVKRIPRARLTFRPAVYGIVRHEDKVLLTRVRSSGKWGLPGGAVELGETLEDALRRELREETGIPVQPEMLLHVSEAFFYYDPADEAYHAFQFFYRCRPLDLQVADEAAIEDGEATAPQWVRIDQLRENDLQEYSKLLLKLLV